jgi:peroxiredoxin Q/BCP
MKDFEKKNAQILGVSFDSVKANASFAEKYKFPFPLLCDTSRDIGMKYGACDSSTASSAKRITYVIDPKGKIRNVYPKVSPATHPTEVLETL